MRTRRTSKRTRSGNKSRASRRRTAAGVFLTVPIVLAFAFGVTGGVRNEPKPLVVNVERRDAYPFVLANDDDRIAPTSVAENYVNGLGERLDLAAPNQETLMATSPAELSYGSAEFADDSTAALETAAHRNSDPLDWGAVGDDPTWRSEIALLENESARFQDAGVKLWSASASEAESDLALNSDVLDKLHCETLLDDDGSPVFSPIEIGASVASVYNAANVDERDSSGESATTVVAPTIVHAVPAAPVASASSAVTSTSYGMPRASAWAPSVATAGSTARAVVY